MKHIPSLRTKLQTITKFEFFAMMEGLLRLVNVAICCLFLFLATNGASIPTEDNKNGSIIYTESLFFVGMADGKAFFVNNDIMLNWTDAKAFCENANMQLASITSQAQATLLNNSYDAVNFFKGYWTSGRDVLDLQQFIWDNDDNQPDRTYVTFSKYDEQQTCLLYDSLPNYLIVRNYICTRPLRPLCETGNFINRK